MKYLVCTIDQLQSGKAFIAEVNGIEIGIFLENEKVFAVRNMCPHKLAPVCEGTVSGTMLPSEPCDFQYGLEGQVLKCPWHGWEFDLASGESLFGISNRKVKTYQTILEKNQIFINL
jgi:nitrite reductase/ring-hydroxylating ferredoxin subunit